MKNLPPCIILEVGYCILLSSKLIYSGDANKAGTYYLSSGCSFGNYKLACFFAYTSAAGFSSFLGMPGENMLITHTKVDSSYKQTTYQVKVAISKSNTFSLSNGAYGRTSMSEYGEFYAWYIAKIYGIN